ncbi:MAG: alkyl hydroperoxide reductase [Dehalococcoidia bacterium]|nr:alkyl hydroperoxide reductase [Dehalococcoidia bacterium]
MQLGQTRDRLQQEGVETVGIIATDADRARRYLRMRPTKLPLAADPDCTTHHSYGVGHIDYSDPAVMKETSKPQYNRDGDLPKSLPWAQAFPALDKHDGHTHSETDIADQTRHKQAQMVGQALVDRDGVLRWVNTEASKGLQGLGGFPTEEELLDLVRSL